jgi:hypothetical protein
MQPSLEWLRDHHNSAWGGPVDLNTPAWQDALQQLSDIAATFYCVDAATPEVSFPLSYC